MKKFLVLTSITNYKDTLLDPSQKFENCDYIAFVDRKFSDIKVWEQRDIIFNSSIDRYSARRDAKIYKIISTVFFPNYEYIIWLDGNHELIVDPQTILDECGDYEMYVFKHPDRTCVYDELKACINWELDDVANLHYQYNFYKSQKFPEQYGLFELSSFIVKNTQLMKSFQLMWYEHINKFSSRDQISFPFCVWKKDIREQITLLEGYSNLFEVNGVMMGNKYFKHSGRHLN